MTDAAAPRKAPPPPPPGRRAAADASLGEMMAQAIGDDDDQGLKTSPDFAVPSEMEDVGTLPSATATSLQTAEEIIAREALPKTPLFSALSDVQLRTMIERVRLVVLQTDQVLFWQGAPADALYVVASGEISVRAPREVARLGEGAFFGEIALLVDQPRGATAVATQPTELLAIDRATVNALIAESPSLLKVFLKFLRDRLTATLMDTNPLFTALGPAQRKPLSSCFQFGSANKGSRLLEQGQPSPGLFILLAGTARVVRDGQPVAELGPGEAFGEMSLLSGEHATAAVEMATRCFLLFMPRDSFAAVIAAHPAVATYLNSLADDRQRVLRLLMI